MSLVYGGEVILGVDSGDGQYKVIGCGRTKNLSTQTATAGKSTKGSGQWEENKAISKSWMATVTGLCSYDTNLDIGTLRNLQFLMAPIGFQFFSKDKNNLGQIYSGQAIIVKVDETGTYNDLDTFSVELKGTGELISNSFSDDLNLIYYGLQDVNTDPINLSLFIESDPAKDITIHYGSVAAPKYFWMAHTVGASKKTNWVDINDVNNKGTIGAALDLFQVRSFAVLGNPYYLYMSSYPTGFTGPYQGVKFYNIPAPVEPPTGLHVISITSLPSSDTGSFTELTETGRVPGVAWTQKFQIAGTPKVGAYIIMSVYGNAVRYDWVTGSTKALAIASLVSQINALNISVATGQRPPSTITANVHSGDSTIIDIIFDYTHSASGAYIMSTVGQADVQLGFDAVTGATDYTIRIINTTLGTAPVYVTGSASPIDVTVDRNYYYSFAVRANFTSGSTAFSPSINQYVP